MIEYLEKFQEAISAADSKFALYEKRLELVGKYAWAIPDQKALDLLKAQGSIVEIGAGGGYWAYELLKQGVDIVAYDIEPGGNKYFDKQWAFVEEGGPSAVRAHKDRALMLCWPPYNSPMAYETLLYYEGDTVIFIGEDWGGCCADDSFFELLAKHFEEVEVYYDLPQWDGIHDHLWVYKRKESL